MPFHVFTSSVPSQSVMYLYQLAHCMKPLSLIHPPWLGRRTGVEACMTPICYEAFGCVVVLGSF